jgi:glycosyltransferase involved in cell wall biosynthesis
VPGQDQARGIISDDTNSLQGELMRLGLIIYSSLDSPGGGFLFNRMLLNHLLRQGDEVEVISLPWGNPCQNLKWNFSRRLPQAIKQLGINILLQDEHVYSSLCLLNRKLRSHLRVPIVAIVHHLNSSEAMTPWRYVRDRLIETPYLRSVDGFIFNSHATRKTVEKLAGAGTAAVVAFPGANRYSLSISSREIVFRAQEAGPLRLVFLGSLIPRKGLHTLLTALSLVPPDLWQLVVVGSFTENPEYVQQVRGQIEALGLSGRVMLSGYLEDEAVAVLLAHSHLLAIPSYYEGLGIAYLEGMSFGLPALATAAGGASEVITHGVDGYLVTPDDAKTLGEHILSLAKDRDLLSRMGLAAQARFFRHPTWEESCSVMHQFLRELAGKQAASL